MYNKIINELNSTRSFNNLYRIPFDIYKKQQQTKSKAVDVNYTLKSKPPLRILLICATAGGFGDIIFAMKLRNYIKQWYSNVIVKIATNGVKQFVSLGEDVNNLYFLQPQSGKKLDHRPLNVFKSFNAKIILDTLIKNPQEDLVQLNLKGYEESLEDFDLYFVAPLTADFVPPNFNHVRSLINNSNRFNTYFFTEYNLPLDKDILFNIGVGDNRLGLFLTDNDTPSKLPNLNYPYSVIYIAENDDNLSPCYEGYLELLTNKFKYKRLDVVAPAWLEGYIKDDLKYLLKKVNNHYSKIRIITTTSNYLIHDTNETKDELVFRFDVLPLPYKDMQRLYYYSLDIMLLTGDQSITDAISCCSENITTFYQSLPWKRNLTSKLGAEIPITFFKSYKTSCGNIKAVQFKGRYKRFIEKWDFRKLGKPYLDAVLLAASDPEVKEFSDIVLDSRTVYSVKKKYIV